MNISVNGDSQVPPGFRFHPTEEELLQYYLKKKVGNETIDLDVICEVDLNKLEPWEIEEKCKIGSSTPQTEWYFFSHKDKKYPTGIRANRATTAGFWKATGRDKMIYSSMNVGQQIGLRKTLVFYKGRAPRGQKSDWIMYEYRLVDYEQNHNYKYEDHHRAVNNEIITTVQVSNKASGAEMEDGWVVCKIFKKKNHQKAAALDNPNNKNLISSADTISNNTNQSNEHNLLQYHPSSPACNDEDDLEYIFRDFEKSLEAQTQTATNMNNKYLIESPNSMCSNTQLPHYNYLHHHDQYNQLSSPPMINRCQLLTSVTENQFSGFPTQQQQLIGSYDGDVKNSVQVTAVAGAAAVDTTTEKIAGSSSFEPIGDWAAFDC